MRQESKKALNMEECDETKATTTSNAQESCSGSANNIRATELPKNEQQKKPSFICGVIEGFYGRPWTTEQRKDLFRK